MKPAKKHPAPKAKRPVPEAKPVRRTKVECRKCGHTWTGSNRYCPCCGEDSVTPWDIFMGNLWTNYKI